MGDRRVGDEGFVGRVEEDDGPIRTGVIDPGGQVVLRCHGPRRVVRKAQINHIDGPIRRLGDEIILRRGRHIDDPRVLARVIARPGASRHDVRIDINGIDRVGHGHHVLDAENLLHVARVGLGPVADKDLIELDADAARAEIVVDNRLPQELVPDAAVVIAAERLLPAHLLDRPVHGLDHRRRQRLRDVPDPHADDLRLRMRLFEGTHPPADLRKQVPGPQLQKILVDANHDSVVLAIERLTAPDARQCGSDRIRVRILRPVPLSVKAM